MIPITVLYKAKILNSTTKSRVTVQYQATVPNSCLSEYFSICRFSALYTKLSKYNISVWACTARKLLWARLFLPWLMIVPKGIQRAAVFFQGITLYHFVTSVIFCVLPLIFRFVGASALFCVLLGNHGLLLFPEGDCNIDLF